MSVNYPLVTIPNRSWHDDPEVCEQAVSALESGHVLYIPELGFPFETNEQRFLEDDFLQLSSKNVSYDPSSGEVRGLKGTRGKADEDRAAIVRMMARYAEFCRDLCASLMGH